MSDRHTERYLDQVAEIAGLIDRSAIERCVDLLVNVRQRGGRIFFIGAGGGAGNCGHAVNDFRKIAGIECYAPTDNVSELTARVNDDGWNSVFASWLEISRLRPEDAIFVFSVGGGDEINNISANIVEALRLAQRVGARVLGVVGRDGGYTARVADACVLVPVVDTSAVTPHTEAFQAVVWHLLVSHPRLQLHEMKWEATR
jgi:D-sedoheptulose 7-phosphate isomerase